MLGGPGRAPGSDAGGPSLLPRKNMPLYLTLLPAALTAATLPPEEGSHSGNAPVEVLLVILIMIVIWGAFRITSKRRQ